MLSKKKKENDKNTNFMMNDNNKVPKMYIWITKCNTLCSGIAPLIRDAACSKLQRGGENITKQKLSVEYALLTM